MIECVVLVLAKLRAAVDTHTRGNVSCPSPLTLFRLLAKLHISTHFISNFENSFLH